MNIPDRLKSKRLRRGPLGSIEQAEFANLVVAFIYLFSGRARRQRIIEAIHDAFSSQFTEADYKLLESQKPPKERWVHNVDWAKRKLVKRGLILEPLESPYGTWILSEDGMRHGQALVS